MKFPYSLSVSLLSKFLLMSPIRVNSFSSFKAVSINSSNLSLYSILNPVVYTYYPLKMVYLYQAKSQAINMKYHSFPSLHVFLHYIRILHECQVWIDKSVPRVTVWHHEARRVIPNCDPRDRFVYPYLTRM